MAQLEENWIYSMFCCTIWIITAPPLEIYPACCCLQVASYRAENGSCTAALVRIVK